MDTVFLSNSGAEAMENAMKITNDYRAPSKYGVAFSGSFHGRTLGTLSLTKSKEVYTRHYPEISGIETVPFCDDRGCDAESCDCGFRRRRLTASQYARARGRSHRPRRDRVSHARADSGRRRLPIPQRGLHAGGRRRHRHLRHPAGRRRDPGRRRSHRRDLGLRPLRNRTRRHRQREGLARRRDHLARRSSPARRTVSDRPSAAATCSGR